MTPAVRLARTASSLLLLAAFGGLVAICAGRAAHWALAPVLTSSMTPTFAPGDLVLTRPADVRELRPGQIAVFVPPGQTSSYAHRIVSVTGDRARPVLRTRGDANPSPDPWTVRLTAPTVPVVVAHLPYSGRLAVLLHGQYVAALLVAVLGLGLTAASVRLILSAPTPIRAVS